MEVGERQEDGQEDGGRNEEEKWQTTRGRQWRKRNPKTINIRREWSRDITSYYVANLPDGCNRKDLETEFGKFGVVVDAYVASRKDRAGNYFGFVRFKSVANKRELEIKLNTIKMDNLKINVNLARFDREGNRLVDDCSQNEHVSHLHKPTHSHPPTVIRYVAPGKSFIDALGKPHGQPSLERTISLDSLETNSFTIWKDKAVVGRAKDMQILSCLYSLLSQSGYGSLRIKYLGGLFVLITDGCDKTATDLLEDTDLWSNWFFKLDKWKGQSLPYERVALIKIHGVPLQLWDRLVFEKIATSFGKIIQVPSTSHEDNNLAYECMGILVSNGYKISCEITIKWQNKSFKCWVSEMHEEWAPDFLEKPNYMPNQKEVGSHPPEIKSGDHTGEAENPMETQVNQPENTEDHILGSDQMEEKINQVADSGRSTVAGGCDGDSNQKIAVTVPNILVNRAVPEDIINLSCGDVNSNGKLISNSNGVDVMAVNETQLIDGYLTGPEAQSIVDPSYFETLVNLGPQLEQVVQGQTNNILSESESGQNIPDVNLSFSGQSNSIVADSFSDKNKLLAKKLAKKKKKKESRKLKTKIWDSFIESIESPDRFSSSGESVDQDQVSESVNPNIAEKNPEVENEVQNTVLVGEILGFMMDGFQDQIKEMIVDEGVNDNWQ